MKELKNNYRIHIIAILCLAVVFIISLCIGKFPITFKALLSGDEMTCRVFFTLRLPRSVMALVAGFGLSMTGSVYQTVFKNPLASPDIIGVSSGASVGAAAAILFFGSSTLATSFFAFLGGIIAVSTSLFLVRVLNQKQITSFVLAGIAINAIAQALLMLMKTLADPTGALAAIEYWTMGSLADITASKLPFTVTVTVTVCLLLLFLHRHILMLSLENDEAKMLGMRVDFILPIVLVLATLVVAGIVSVTGLISFIGLLGPHIARLISKDSKATSLLLGGTIGAILLLVADILARSISSNEVPISVISSLLGAPFLLYLIRRGGRIQ